MYNIQDIRKALFYFRLLFLSVDKKKFGAFGEDSDIEYPFFYAGTRKNIFIGKRVWINSFARINVPCGNFTIRDNCSVGQGLTVVSFNHIYDSWDDVPESGKWRKISNNHADSVVVNEHCWIGANVTLLAGCVIGRGSLVAAGSVCTAKAYPPYSIIAGVPAKVIRPRLTLEEQIKHEKEFFSSEERISPGILEENYRKYYKK